MITLHTNIAPALLALGQVGGDIASQINTNEILDAGGAVLLNRIRGRFLRQVDADNVPWIPSKAGLRRKLLGGPGTLYKTGKLWHSLQLHASGPNDRDISTDVDYAKYHQLGIGQLRREFLAFSMEDEQVFTNVVKKMLDRQLKRLTNG